MTPESILLIAGILLAGFLGLAPLARRDFRRWQKLRLRERSRWVSEPAKQELAARPEKSRLKPLDR